ncbi:hypothetical protein PENTCL1PPCAC_19231, partial [Pristionchus entomophagus]
KFENHYARRFKGTLLGRFLLFLHERTYSSNSHSSSVCKSLTPFSFFISPCLGLESAVGSRIIISSSSHFIADGSLFSIGPISEYPGSFFNCSSCLGFSSTATSENSP